MKLIIAFVRPFLIDRIIVALEDIDEFPGATIVEVKGFGRGLRYSRDEMLNPLHETKQIEIVVPDEMVERIVTVIREQAHTGRKGDGFVCILPIVGTVLI